MKNDLDTLNKFDSFFVSDEELKKFENKMRNEKIIKPLRNFLIIAASTVVLGVSLPFTGILDSAPAINTIFETSLFASCGFGVANFLKFYKNYRNPLYDDKDIEKEFGKMEGRSK